MSARSYGTSIEKRAEKLLLANGDIVHRMRRSAVFIGPGKVVSRQQDLFMTFDLIAISPSTGGVRLIQTTTSYARSISVRKQKVEEWAGKKLEESSGGWFAALILASRDGRGQPVMLSPEVWAWGRWPVAARRVGKKRAPTAYGFRMWILGEHGWELV